jgi:flagellar motor switch/type III secretory pathway protein FliN
VSKGTSPTDGSRSVARPYPWGALDAVTRDDVAAVRALNAGAGEFAPGLVGDALSELLGARVQVFVRRARGGARAPRGGEGIGVVVSAIDAPDLSRAVLVEVEPALGAALFTRAVRRAGPRVLAPGSAGAALGGAVGAILLATARRILARSSGGVLPRKAPPRVVAAGPARALERDLTSANLALDEVSLTVLVDDDAFAARVLVPRLLFAVPASPWTPAALATLGDVPLELPIIAAVSRSTAAELGSLRRGDAWLPGAWALHVSSSGALAGPVLLAAGASEEGLRAVLGEDGRLVLREGREPVAWAEEESDVGEVKKDALLEAVGEAPVVVRVEIGVAEMRAREWASLAPGDVVALGRRVGEAVTLRVSGVSVARGELVDLDGEVAVRILGRAEETTEPGSAPGPSRDTR